MPSETELKATTMEHFEALPIGTTIFVPSIESKTIEVECPDCKGTKYWHVYAGKQNFMIDCPRCDGGKCDWLKPKRHEYAAKVEETTVKSVRIESGRAHGSETETYTRIYYETSPYMGSISEPYITREAAEAAAEIKLQQALEREQSDWDKDRERDAKRAGMEIVRVIEARASRNAQALQDKIDSLKRAMLDAIRDGDGPELRRPYSGAAPEMTPQAIADFLANILSEANINGFTEDELHEAMCHC